MVAVSFHPLVARWFSERFVAPTESQLRAWPEIRAGRDVLISAPTGSGKTLAAFLICLDDLVARSLDGTLEDTIDVVYVSPLKALSNDVRKNLEAPLAEISELAPTAGFRTPGVRTAVRTGDTPASERQRMVRQPPHILVTTPESLYILLTAERSRAALSRVRTIIIDEIHAVVDDKRGSHLALSVARLEDLVQKAGGRRLQRIGLSATVRPIATIASFLSPSHDSPSTRAESSSDVVLIDHGHRRPLDLAVEVPDEELSVVASQEMWGDIYDRLAELISIHQTTLVFVNTRQLAERVAHHLEDRLGEQTVLAHHGSLSPRLRLMAETRLKQGQLRAVVATASLELGIDVGSVDLVCQIGSPRSIGVALQRIGRSGHSVDRPGVTFVPKGRLFPTTRDELIECAALVRAIRSGSLESLEIPEWPRDVLSQQIVAAAACETWQEDDLFALVRSTHPYRNLPRVEFDAIVEVLSEGIATRRGRGSSYLHRDQVNGTVRGRRNARLAAITCGGAIPDNANYLVVAEPEGTTVGTIDEDFAIESMAGDVFLLGTTSWRIRRVEAGRVRVEDAHGAAPSVPFWRGEAPGRTSELSAEVSTVMRALIDLSTPTDTPSANDRAVEFLTRECGLDRAGAEQAAAYVRAGTAELGTVPTNRSIVAERFFDESGGMQLVLHAPFGARINRAWGLSLRKTFCRSFNFELQAAATDNGIVISLSDQHSFPLESVLRFLNPDTVTDVLTQAQLASPMFTARWRWNATRALAVLRFAGGRKVPPPLIRMRSDDLLAAVFPEQVACAENLEAGDIPIPDHPLVNETVRDCMHEAMDIDGLRTVLEGIENGTIETVSIDTAEPSPFSHEILNANPYAFLDDAPLEERRARAVQMRRSLGSSGDEIGALDPAAIAEVAQESWPTIRYADELHDALLTLIVMPPTPGPDVNGAPGDRVDHEPFLRDLQAHRRATTLRLGDARLWVPAERLAIARLLYPDWLPDADIPSVGARRPVSRDAAVGELLRGWLDSIGPVTASALATRLEIPRDLVEIGLARLESEGSILRGRFSARTQPIDELEWCNRRVLARIHRLTLSTLRREIEPVSSAKFMRFLVRWQHLAPGTQLHGEDGVRAILHQLQGYEISAAAWESSVLRHRIARYEPELLDRLCLSGEVVWGRLSPHPAFDAVAARETTTEPRRTRRVRPTRVAPVTIFLREDGTWLASNGPERDVSTLADQPLSHPARELLAALEQRGASFLPELIKSTGRLASEVEDGLWELVAAGLVTADGFDNLRALVDPKRRRGEGKWRNSRPRHAAGRWALLRPAVAEADAAGHDPFDGPARLERTEAFARQLLRRWGVVFRDLLTRETLAPPWRELLSSLRRLEARGEIRGGRFVAGHVGEQFARPEAVDLLRAIRREPDAAEPLRVPAADPLNLAGIVTPGPRVSPLAGVSVDVLAEAPDKETAVGG